MTDAIAFTLPGVPVAKGRPRALARLVKVGGVVKAIVQVITPPATREAEKRLQVAARAFMAATYGTGDNARPLAGPVRMMVVAVYPPPASWTKSLQAALQRGVVYHTGKPDADNLAKLVGDALNEIVYQDDSQVAELIVRKRYGSPARTDITVTPLASAGMTPADKRRAPPAPSLPLVARAKPNTARDLDASPRLL